MAGDVNLVVGTCGWSYPDWVGPFYPPGTPSNEMLFHYARVFDAVEVNSTFYATPPKRRVKNWDRDTPSGFRFSVKAPQAFTHDSRLRLDEQGRDALGGFVDAIEPLGVKLERILVQLPPSLSAREGLDRLEALLEAEPFPVPIALEARHPSWDQDEVFDLLREHEATWVWSENDAWSTPPVATTSEAYVRLIGDRELDTFNRIQRDPEPVINTWISRLEDQAGGVIREARVFADNHFAGFGPGTVNAVLRRAGQEPRTWDASKKQGQATLGDFDEDE